MTDKEIVERAKEAEKRTCFGELVHSPISKGVNSAYGIGYIEGMVEYRNSMQKEPVSEDLEKVAELYNLDDSIKPWRNLTKEAFKAGAKWQKNHLWKPADGDDLPEYDREVIVLIKYNTQRNIHDEEYPTYRVGFGHRPNPDGWDGKNIDTNEVTHYTPKLYDKRGWNTPDIVCWLDVKLPKEIEEL